MRRCAPGKQHNFAQVHPDPAAWKGARLGPFAGEVAWTEVFSIVLICFVGGMLRLPSFKMRGERPLSLSKRDPSGVRTSQGWGTVIDLTNDFFSHAVVSTAEK